MKCSSFLFIFSSLISLSACAENPTYSDLNIRLSLESTGGICNVKSDSKDTGLLISGHCIFHLNANGEVREYYDGSVKYILVESSVIHPELPENCLTQLQSIKVVKNKYIVSDYKDTVASCPPFQWDAHVFTGLFK
jgi:hypothetical protein